MSKKFATGLVLIGACLTFVLDATIARGDIIVMSSFRSTSTDANLTGNPGIPDGTNNTDGGQFRNDAMTDVTVDPEHVRTNAHQDSTMPNLTGLAMFGTGSVDYDVLKITSGGSGSAQSFFDVFFEVNAVADYMLSGSLKREFSGPLALPDASVLFECTGGPVFLDRSAVGSGSDEPFSVIASLSPGGIYHLKLESKFDFPFLDADAFAETNGASFSFLIEPSASAVPEPMSLVLAAVGAIGLIGYRRARRMPAVRLSV